MYKRKTFIIAIILTLFVSLLFFGFERLKYKPIIDINNNMPSLTNSIKPELLRCVSFKMDTLTEPSNIRYFEYYLSPSDSCEYLTFLNPDINAIYFFDLRTSEFKKKISLNAYGFNINSEIQGYHILNDDSLAIYSYKDSRLSLLSLKSGVFLKVTLGNKFGSNVETVHPFVSTRTPILMNEDTKKIFLTGFSADEGGVGNRDKKRRTMTSFDLSTGDIRYGINYPRPYWDINWGGGGGLRQVFFELIQDTILVSFMADHNVYLFNRDLLPIDTIYFGSKYIKSTHSMKYSNTYFEFIHFYEIYDYYLQTPNYSCIKYDKYRQLYYRIAELPDLIEMDGIYKKKKSIIVMNKDLKLVGEWKAPNLDYNFNEALITRNALLVRKQLDNEDVLSFCELKFK